MHEMQVTMRYLVELFPGIHSQSLLQRTSSSQVSQAREGDLDAEPSEILAPGSLEGSEAPELWESRGVLGIDAERTSTGGTIPVGELARVESDYRDLICSYDWPCDWAMSVVRCESSGKAEAVATEQYEGRTLQFMGLFQVWDGSLHPAENVRQAYAQWLEWQRGERANPWPNCPRYAQ